MQTLDPSPKEKLQDKSSQPTQPSPSTSAGASKMSEVNKSLSTLDNSPVSIKLNEPGGSKKLESPNEEGQYDRLYTSLKALVTKVVSQFRKSISDEMLDWDPISYQLPQNNEGVNVSTIKTNPSSSVEVKTGAKSTLVGEETVSFLLPPDCLIRTDLDKDIQHQSSFKERLQGWHISCRRRANGKLDMNYRHGQSSKMFRSTVEVVQFIMKAFNDKETLGSSSLQEQGPATEMKGSSKKKISSSKKERIPPSKSLKISSEEKIVVEQFLEESDNNLNNICESEEWEKYLKSSNENEDNASSDEETQ